MLLEHVVSILESLANGIDPATDTEIPDSTFRSPEVIRALFTASAMLQQRPDDAAATRRSRPAAAGARWSDEEDAEVCREYWAGASFTAIAEEHTRATGGIMRRPVRRGR